MFLTCHVRRRRTCGHSQDNQPERMQAQDSLCMRMLVNATRARQGIECALTRFHTHAFVAVDFSYACTNEHQCLFCVPRIRPEFFLEFDCLMHKVRLAHLVLRMLRVSRRLLQGHVRVRQLRSRNALIKGDAVCCVETVWWDNWDNAKVRDGGTHLGGVWFPVRMCSYRSVEACRVRRCGDRERRKGW